MSQAAHQERLMTVIRGPHLSEKAHFAAEKNQVVLKVRTDATKKEIQQAVELLFEVQVENGPGCQRQRQDQALPADERSSQRLEESLRETG